MKRIKKLASLMLAVVMVLAMGITTFAAGTNSITVDGAKEGETYKIYKMLDLSVHENSDSTGAENEKYDSFSYTINETWKQFWTAGSGKDYIDTTTVGSETYVSWKDDKKDNESMEAFGKAAAQWAKENNINAVKDKIVGEGEKASFTELEDGYYMITSTYGTAVTVASTPNNANQQIKEKNIENTTEKKVLEALERNKSGDTWGDSNDAAVGDTVTFRSKVNIAKNSVNVVYHDTMDDGLTFNGIGEVKVYTDEDCKTELGSTNYEVTANVEGETFQVRFQNKYVESLTEVTTVLYIKYTAVLNDKAQVTDPENNTAKITWGNSGESKEDTTETYTHSFQIHKYDASDTEKSSYLADAKFQLFIYENGGEALSLAVATDKMTYRVVNEEEELPKGYTMAEDNKIVTVSTGLITVIGVDSDDYWLEETDAPSGYNKMDRRVKVEVDAENAYKAEVPNQSGTILPSTGGIGTTIFYVVGGILVIGAGILLVAKKRMGTHK